MTPLLTITKLLPLFNRALIVILLSCASVAQALPDDRLQAIEIDADYAEQNANTGFMVYRGSVVIRQGSILLEADRVEIHTRNNRVQQIVATGEPASYHQQINAGEEPLIARAKRIEYQLDTDSVALKSNASLTRDGTLIRGDTIDYDLSNQTWKASGNNSGKQKRIQLVIPASQTTSDSNNDSKESP